jgi:hypothetical protein
MTMQGVTMRHVKLLTLAGTDSAKAAAPAACKLTKQGTSTSTARPATAR